MYVVVKVRCVNGRRSIYIYMLLLRSGVSMYGVVYIHVVFKVRCVNQWVIFDPRIIVIPPSEQFHRSEARRWTQRQPYV